ncbi:MAG TPA: hypothetical protein VIY30_16990, partial [Burkholderiaceae bacterium]
LAALPPAAADALVVQANALREATDRLRGLTAIARAAPAAAGLRDALERTIADTAGSRHLDLGAFLQQAFEALGVVMRNAPADAMRFHAAIALLDTLQANESWRIRLLAALARHAPDEAARLAVAQAIRTAKVQPDRLEDALVPAHADALAHWVDTLVAQDGEVERLVPVLHAAAPLLPLSSRARAAEWIAGSPDLEQRFLGLDALLPLLPRAQAKAIAQSQLERIAEWSRPPAIQLLGLATLARHAPAALARHLDDLDRVLRLLSPTDSLPRLAPLIEAVPQVRAHLPALLERLADAPDDAQAKAIVLVATTLDAATTRQWLTRLPVDVPLHPAWSALVARMAAVDDADAAQAALTRLDNRFWEDDVVEHAAPSLPVHALRTMSTHGPRAGRPGEDGPRGSGALEALALRAAELGDPTLALALLDCRGGRTGWDEGLQAVCRATPRARLGPLLDALQLLQADERAQAIAEILPRLPRARRRPAILQLARDAGGLRIARAPRRVELLHRCGDTLARLPKRQLVSIWIAALDGSRGSSREEVLADVLAYAPALIARFGPGVAAALDAAIQVASGPRWP